MNITAVDVNASRTLLNIDRSNYQYWREQLGVANSTKNAKKRDLALRQISITRRLLKQGIAQLEADLKAHSNAKFDALRTQLPLPAVTELSVVQAAA